MTQEKCGWRQLAEQRAHTIEEMQRIVDELREDIRKRRMALYKHLKETGELTRKLELCAKK